MLNVPEPRKETESVSPETLRKRRSFINEMIEDQFGKDGENYFIAETIRRKGKEEREILYY